MNAQVANKIENKVNSKTNTDKTGADQQKVINQLKQEIKKLNKTIQDLQKKQDTQKVVFTIPRELLAKANALMSDYTKKSGEKMSLSEFICDAIDVYVWGIEEDGRVEEERERAELVEKNKLK